MKQALRFLCNLVTILYCTTIASAAVQKTLEAAIFEKIGAPEGEISFLTEFVAPRTGGHAFDMVNNPGPLAAMRGNPAANFAGGRYNATTLTDDLILHRAGDAGTDLGQWFTRSPAQSVAQVRIDSAVKPQWFDEAGALTGSSPLNTNFSIRISRGTTIYEGPVGYQGGVYLGGHGTNQIFVPQPWNIKGVEVLGSSPLR